MNVLKLPQQVPEAVEVGALHRSGAADIGLNGDLRQLSAKPQQDTPEAAPVEVPDDAKHTQKVGIGRAGTAQAPDTEE